MDENYHKYLELIENYYNSKNNSLTRQVKYLKCGGCDEDKIYEENQDTIYNEGSRKTIVLSCGGGKGDCGKKIEIVLPKYIYKDKEIESLKIDLENTINWDIISKYIKIDSKFIDSNKDLIEQNNKQIHEIREKYYDIYRKNSVRDIEEKYSVILKFKLECQNIKEELKDINTSPEEKKLKRQDYINNLSKINQLYSEIKEITDNVKEYFMDEEPIIKIDKLDIVESVKPKKKKKKDKKDKKKKASLNDFKVGMHVEYVSKGETKDGIIDKIDPNKYDNKLFVKKGNTVSIVPISKLKIISVKKDPVKEEVVEEVEEVEKDEIEEVEGDTIVIGSKVKWTDKKNNELTGLVEKITDKSYKICCKDGKKSGDKGSLYMVSKDDVSLD